MEKMNCAELIALKNSEEYKNGKLIIKDKIFIDEKLSSVEKLNRIDNVVFENVKFINTPYSYLIFYESVFRNCLFENSDFQGFGGCKFEDCIFDNLEASHNWGLNDNEFHNLVTTERQRMLPVNYHPSFYDSDLSGQERFFTSGKCVHLQHFHFENCMIDLKTIERMADKCEYLWFRTTPQDLCKSKVGEDKYSQPMACFYAQNASREVKMNFIMAMFAHDLTFEIDNTDTSLDFLPMHVKSKLKDETLFIVDEEGREVDLTKIVPFDFDLRWNDNMTRECDLSIYNDKIKVVPTKE